ncbi:MAG: DUF3443 family protein [Ferrovum myxofaciens]|uniref:DUF3443 family protein n=1 Tax=Ferrovum myxofaciens TaxID=416213 RepID=UPI0023554633|nr:DUF3443 family protein [Ferrovum myxofaciens]QKE41886.1 MAG: DUF3443 family protein [Ferrovum myxofaciens]
MKTPSLKFFLRALIPGLFLALTACGGGGGGGGGGGTMTTAQTCNALTVPATSIPTPFTASPSTTANQVPVTVEQYAAVNYPTMNLPYVTVQVCHGSQCVTIDHVIVDTGSYGLRVRADFPGISNLNLPAVTNGTAPVMECAQFLGGYMWGGVYQATVKVGGEATINPIPIQLVGGQNSFTPPSSCSSSGSNIGNLSGIGGNGLLGVGVFLHDLSPYYACTTNANTGSGNLALTSIVSNPVVAFSSDNNGTILTLPTIASTGQTTASGTLTFGINTQANNSLTSGYSVVPVPASGPNIGNFTASLSGQSGTYPASFFDSGSNLYFIPLTGIPTNSSGNYNPQSLQTITGTATSFVTPSNTAPLSFGLLDITNYLNGGNVAFNDSGSDNGATAGSADFGLPYFYGHSIINGLNGAQATQGSTSFTGPFYAVK